MHDCKLAGKMWQKADTWKIDNVESSLLQKIHHLDREISSLRYQVEQVNQARIIKDQEIEALRDDLNNLRQQLLPDLAPAKTEAQETRP